MSSFYNEQTLKLDVKQQQPNKIPRFVQNDSALLKIELYDDGKLYDVSRANDFTISVKRPDGTKVSGLAKFDGKIITYQLAKQDLEMEGEHEARLQVFAGRRRLSSLSFRYDVYEDYEAVGDPNQITLLSALLAQVRDALKEAQRQGGYAENRGDFANVAGDYANKSGDSQKMRWLRWVKTITERNSKYPNPRNGDTVYVVNVTDKNGGAVYRYNGVNRPYKWEEIAGWDTSIIQDIYNMLGDLDSKKETKAKVAELVDNLQEELAATRIGANNIIKQTDTSIASNDVIYSPVVSSSELTMVSTDRGRVVQVRLPDDSQSYYGATIGNTSSRRFSVTEGETLTLSFLGSKSLTATDFTYVYIMRPNSEGTNKAMTLIKKHDIDSSVYDKYEFNVTVPWSSDNAYLLIGSNRKEEYKGTGNPYWIRFKDVSVVRGTRAADWAPSFDDVVSKAQTMVEEVRDELSGIISKHNSRIDVLENKIKMTVTETQYDSKLKEIAKWQSNYEQTARDITTTVSKKVGQDEVISTINQTAGSIKISANKIHLGGDVVIENGRTKIKHIDFNQATASGGSSSEYLQLDGDEILLRGKYTRTWRNKLEKNNDVLTRLRLGHLRFRNNTLNRSLYYSDFGISTYIDGDGDAAASGTINFFDTEYSTARGLTMESNYGVVALRSNKNRIILESDLTTNIESSKYSIYFRPMRDNRGGTNEFQFWVKSNNSSSKTDGVLSYGNLTTAGDHGASLRFSKQRGLNTIYATNPNGDKGTGYFDAKGFVGDLIAPSSYVYAVGERMRVIKNESQRNSYAEFQAGDGLFNSIRTNDGDVNFYIGVSTQELRVTNNLLWNGGSTGYRPVRASNFIEASSEKFKTNIEKWNDSVLDEFRNNIQLYSYNLNSDLESGEVKTRHGVIVERETPEAWVNGDGIVNYEITAWTAKGVQELVHENDKLKDEMAALRKEMEEIKSLITAK